MLRFSLLSRKLSNLITDKPLKSIVNLICKYEWIRQRYKNLRFIYIFCCVFHHKHFFYWTDLTVTNNIKIEYNSSSLLQFLSLWKQFSLGLYLKIEICIKTVEQYTALNLKLLLYVMSHIQFSLHLIFDVLDLQNFAAF